MKAILLDTNFILTCVKQKIDFFEFLEFEGFKILIPKQVIGEIKNFSKSEKKLHFKKDAELALKILGENNFKKVDLKMNNVDGGIIKFAAENPKIVIATLDREIKKKVKNQKLVVRGNKELEIL